MILIQIGHAYIATTPISGTTQKLYAVNAGVDSPIARAPPREITVTVPALPVNQPSTIHVTNAFKNPSFLVAIASVNVVG
jgi:hypothetical protein